MLYFSQLGKCVQMLSSDVDGLRDVICVLVEMHAACMSRHSVQRTLARYIYILHVLVFCQTLIIGVGNSLTLRGTDMFTLDRSFPTQTHTQHDSTCIVHTGSLIAHNYAIIFIFACLKQPVILMYVCLCCEFVACDSAATGKFLLCHRRSKIFHCWKVRSKFAFVN